MARRAANTVPATAPEVVVAGHLCLDIIPGLPRATGGLFTPGKLTAVGPGVITTGGAVANTALALRKLGVSARAIGKVGDDLMGRSARGILEDGGLATSLKVGAKESTAYAVVVAPPGSDRMFWAHSGANDEFGEADVLASDLAGVRLVHVGYPPLLRRMYLRRGHELQRLMARAKAAGATTSLDMSLPDPLAESGKVDWVALLENVLPSTDVFLPSLDEILFMLDRPALKRLSREAAGRNLAAVATLDEVAGVASRLLELGPAIVGIKLGDEGLYLRTTSDLARLAAAGAAMPAVAEPWLGRELHSPCFQARVVNATGSGDCTIAGLMAAMLRGLSPEEAATMAVAVGARSVGAADATSGLIGWRETMRKVGEGWRRRPSRLAGVDWKAIGAGMRAGPNDSASAHVATKRRATRFSGKAQQR